MIIPYQNLPAETLMALIEDFITREGTDYGAQEIDLSVKVEQIKSALVHGEIAIVFDAASESTSILPACDAKALL